MLQRCSLVCEQQFASQPPYRKYRHLEGGLSMHSHRIFETVLSITRHLLAGASILVAALFAGPSFADHDARPVKVMIINMFGGTPFPFSAVSVSSTNTA